MPPLIFSLVRGTFTFEYKNYKLQMEFIRKCFSKYTFLFLQIKFNFSNDRENRMNNISFLKRNYFLSETKLIIF